jgi:hypothetical protein
MFAPTLDYMSVIHQPIIDDATAAARTAVLMPTHVYMPAQLCLYSFMKPLHIYN